MGIDTVTNIFFRGEIKLGIRDPANKVTIKIVKFILCTAPGISTINRAIKFIPLKISIPG
jgi:hypothetical protein